MCQSFYVDLKQWIADDHASVAKRFDNAIAQHVPEHHWKTSSQTSSTSSSQTSSTSGGGTSPSIAWLLFHMTYHQDLALNTAVRNHDPILAAHRGELGLGHLVSADGLSEAEDSRVTDALVLAKLASYVDAVNTATAEWIDDLSVMALDSIPGAGWRLTHKVGIPADGDMSWLHAMWNAKTVAWFVQWECIGHGHAHVGEMVGIRNRLGLSPF